MDTQDGGAALVASRRSPAYARVVDTIAAGRCVVLDGGIGTELPRAAAGASVLDERLWGVGSLVDAPDAVLEVHRGYVEAGCDVITTNTWGHLSLDGRDLMVAYLVEVTRKERS